MLITLFDAPTTAIDRGDSSRSMGDGSDAFDLFGTAVPLFCWCGVVTDGSEDDSGVDEGGGRAGEDLAAVLVGRGEGEVDEVLAALLAHGHDLGARRQRVSRPHLGDEAATEAAQPAVTHVV